MSFGMATSTLPAPIHTPGRPAKRIKRLKRELRLLARELRPVSCANAKRHAGQFVCGQVLGEGKPKKDQCRELNEAYAAVSRS